MNEFLVPIALPGVLIAPLSWKEPIGDGPVSPTGHLNKVLTVICYISVTIVLQVLINVLKLVLHGSEIYSIYVCTQDYSNEY